MNIIHLLFIFHKQNVKFCFVKKKHKKILVILIIFHKFAQKICFMGEKYPCGKRLFYS